MARSQYRGEMATLTRFYLDFMEEYNGFLISVLIIEVINLSLKTGYTVINYQ